MERCTDCPVTDIEHVRATSAAGRLLERTLELEFDTKHFRVDWADVTAEEVQALKILEQERGKWQAEDQERRREEWEEQRRAQQR